MNISKKQYTESEWQYLKTYSKSIVIESYDFFCKKYLFTLYNRNFFSCSQTNTQSIDLHN